LDKRIRVWLISAQQIGQLGDVGRYPPCLAVPSLRPLLQHARPLPDGEFDPLARSRWLMPHSVSMVLVHFLRVVTIPPSDLAPFLHWRGLFSAGHLFGSCTAQMLDPAPARLWFFIAAC
jgi:hypothetical protein